MADAQRIAKLLARAGVASRREIERMIEERRIAIDGEAIETPATIVTSLRGVTVDGRPVAEPAPARLFLYHKPAGVLTAERDPAGRPTIYDRLPEGLPRVVPVGRLDLNTEGLLLLTTDGGLKRLLELPSTGVERTYRARAHGQVSQDQLESLSEGIEIEGVRYGSIDANMERRTGANVWIEMRLREGRNREVRRVLEHLGLEVNRLIRTAYGEFVLADLPAGEAVEVRQHDLVAFRKGLKGGGEDAFASAAPHPSTAPSPKPRPVRPDQAPRPLRRSPASPVREPRRTGESPATERSTRPARPRSPGADDTRAPRPARGGSDQPFARDTLPRGRREGSSPVPVRSEASAVRGRGRRPSPADATPPGRDAPQSTRPFRRTERTGFVDDDRRPARPGRPREVDREARPSADRGRSDKPGRGRGISDRSHDAAPPRARAPERGERPVRSAGRPARADRTEGSSRPKGGRSGETRPDRGDADHRTTRPTRPDRPTAPRDDRPARPERTGRLSPGSGRPTGPGKPPRPARSGGRPSRPRRP